MRVFILVFLLLAVPATADEQRIFAGAVPHPEHALQGKALLTAMRSGGYVVYFRHMATQDAPPEMAHCRGSVLSPQGRADAEQLGKVIAALKIPFGDVRGSPPCRTIDSATLMFGKAATEPVIFGELGSFAKLGGLLTTAPPAGTNRALVGHYSGSNVLVGPPQLNFGEALIFKPGTPTFIVARLMPDQWEKLDQ